jgi:hypothetical protein
MSGLEILLAVAGVGVTVLVGLGMVLITPLGAVERGAEETGGRDAEESDRPSSSSSPASLVEEPL